MSRLEMATILLAGVLSSLNFKIGPEEGQKRAFCALVIEYADELRKADAKKG